jgi:hypothetical protein
LTGGVLLAGATSAGAMPPPCDRVDNPCPDGDKVAHGTVDVAAGNTLSVRRKPRSTAKKIRSLKDGKRIVIVCQTNGSQVTGTFGTSRLWDKLKKGGYVSDTFVSTGSDGRVAPSCPRTTTRTRTPRRTTRTRGPSTTASARASSRSGSTA